MREMQKNVIKNSKEDAVIGLWVSFPGASELYEDENGIFWLDKETAKHQGANKKGKVTIYKRKDKKIK